MTPCFANKRKENKLKMYYYYRCTSTFNGDWNACSTRQVNATRLEDYVIDNLNRISLDKNYIENLIFRLNNEVESGNRSGYELTEKCSLLSSQTLQNTLKIFLKSLGKKELKGIF